MLLRDMKFNGNGMGGLLYVIMYWEPLGHCMIGQALVAFNCTY
jgi:hypothetical protein